MQNCLVKSRFNWNFQLKCPFVIKNIDLICNILNFIVLLSNIFLKIITAKDITFKIQIRHEYLIQGA